MDVGGERGHLLVVGDVERAVGGAPARRAHARRRPSASSPSALRSVRNSSAPSAASFSAVARADAAGRARSGSTVCPRIRSAAPWRATLPARGQPALDAVATPQGVEPQPLQHLDAPVPGRCPCPTKALSCDSVIAVVAVSMRTRAGTSSEIGPGAGVLLDDADDLVDHARPRSRSSSRGSAASVFCATVHAAMIGSLLANTAAALPTIRLANAGGDSPGSRGAKSWVSLSSSASASLSDERPALRTWSRSRSRSPIGPRRHAR